MKKLIKSIENDLERIVPEPDVRTIKIENDNFSKVYLVNF